MGSWSLFLDEDTREEKKDEGGKGYRTRGGLSNNAFGQVKINLILSVKLSIFSYSSVYTYVLGAQ